MKRNLGREQHPCWPLGALVPPDHSVPRGQHPPGGDGHLGHPPQHGGLEQPHEGHKGLLQELHLPHQHVGGLSVLGDLLDELVLQLLGKTRPRKGVVAKIWLVPLFFPFFTQVEASGSKISPLVVPGAPEVGTEEPQLGISQQKFTKPNCFKNMAEKTEAGSKMPP